MQTKKKIYFMILIFVLLAISILTIFGGRNIQARRALNRFSNLIGTENLDGVRLTIYYMNTFIFTNPISVDELIRRSDVDSYTNKIIVYGDSLEEHRGLLKQLNSKAFTPVIKKSYLDTRLCYIFETDDDGEILVVAFGDLGNIIFVNGVEVKSNKIFIDIIKPFLTEDAIKKLAGYFN